MNKLPILTNDLESDHEPILEYQQPSEYSTKIGAFILVHVKSEK